MAVANTPGLAGSLLVGLVAAKALCVARDIPLVAVNHLQAHIYACRLAAAPQEVFPCVGLIVSGGHTSLYRCLGPLDFELLGATIDDAAGEAFDKVAAMLGLPYPGGPAIAQAAAGGDPRAYALPRSFFAGRRAAGFQLQRPEDGGALHDRRARAGPISPAWNSTPRQVADLAASFQEAVVDTLVDKAFAALRQDRFADSVRGRRRGGQCPAARPLARGGRAAAACSFTWPRLRLCTDNAVMGAIALERLKAGLVEKLDLEVYPGVVRARAGGRPNSAGKMGCPLSLVRRGPSVGCPFRPCPRRPQLLDELLFLVFACGW